MIDSAKYHIGLVEECFEDGACGNFYILADDDGIDSDTYLRSKRETEKVAVYYGTLSKDKKQES